MPLLVATSQFLVISLGLHFAGGQGPMGYPHTNKSIPPFLLKDCMGRGYHLFHALFNVLPMHRIITHSHRAVFQFLDSLVAHIVSYYWVGDTFLTALICWAENDGEPLPNSM